MAPQKEAFSRKDAKRAKKEKFFWDFKTWRLRAFAGENRKRQRE
jgi:hypothetical protein